MIVLVYPNKDPALSSSDVARLLSGGPHFPALCHLPALSKTSAQPAQFWRPTREAPCVTTTQLQPRLLAIPITTRWRITTPRLSIEITIQTRSRARTKCEFLLNKCSQAPVVLYSFGATPGLDASDIVSGATDTDNQQDLKVCSHRQVLRSQRPHHLSLTHPLYLMSFDYVPANSTYSHRRTNG